jgi:SEC-C motif
VTERRILLDCAAFLDSAHAIAIDFAKAGDVRTVIQRYLAACYVDVGKAPRLLEGDELSTLLCEILPRHFGVKDPLAAVTEDVLGAYLTHLDETEVVVAAFEQRRAFEGSIAVFQEAVASGIAHQDGIAVTGKGKTIVHHAEKTGRNDPCPCGSGKKFKKCCARLGGS